MLNIIPKWFLQKRDVPVEKAILYFSFFFFLLLFVYRVMLIFSFNGEIGGIDNNFISGVIRMAAGFDIYSNPENLPFSVNQYPPLYFEISAFCADLFCVDFDSNPINIYWLCRALSLTYDTLTVLLMFIILRKNFCINNSIAIMLAVIFFYILGFYGYTFSRTDSLYLFFYTFTILRISGKKCPKIINIFFLAILTVFSIFSKQSGIVLPVIIVYLLVIKGNTKKAFIYFITAGTLLLTIIYFYSLRHPYFALNVINGIINRIDLSWFYGEIFKPFALTLPALLLYYTFVISLRYSLNKSDSKKNQLYTIFIIQFFFSLLICIKWGSTLGYFYEPFLLSLLLLGIELKTKMSMYPQLVKKILRFSLPLIFIFYIYTLSQIHLFFIQEQPIKKKIYYEQSIVADYLKKKYPKTYIFESGNVNRNFFKAFCYKNYAFPNYDVIDCCAYPDKMFNYSNLTNAIVNGQIGVIVTDNNIQPKEIWGINLEKFHYDTSLFQYSIYIHDKAKNNYLVH